MFIRARSSSRDHDHGHSHGQGPASAAIAVRGAAAALLGVTAANFSHAAFAVTGTASSAFKMRVPIAITGSAQANFVKKADFRIAGSASGELVASAVNHAVAGFAVTGSAAAKLASAVAFAIGGSAVAAFSPRAGFLISGTAAADLDNSTAAFANGYIYRRLVAIAGERAVAGTTITGYLLYINEARSAFKTIANGGVIRSDFGFDFRFETTAGVKLPHELVDYDPVIGSLQAYVRIPSWDVKNQLRIYIYYGKNGLVATDADAPAALVDYIAVWDARTGADRSGRGRDLNPTAITAGTLIGDAGSYNGTTSSAVSTAITSWWGGWPAATVQMWVKPDATLTAPADPSELNRGFFIQGTPGTKGTDCGMAVFWRETAADTTITRPLFANFSCGTTVASQAYAVGPKNSQKPGVSQLIHATWASGGKPKLYLDSDLLVNSSDQIGTGTIAKLGNGNLYLGEATGNATFPRFGTWKGLLDEVRLRAQELPIAHISAEYDNWTVPTLFYALGAEDLAGDADQGPVAAPTFDIAGTQNTPQTIDVLADDFDPEGDAKTLFSMTAISNCTVVPDASNANKVRFTPAAITVPFRAIFRYTVQAGTKQAVGFCSVVVTAAGPVSPEVRVTPAETITSDAMLTTFIADNDATNVATMS